MQERYLGDIHDYYKFLFLKFLSLNLKEQIGLNWYLVDPKEISLKEVEKNDGEKIQVPLGNSWTLPTISVIHQFVFSTTYLL